MIDFEVLETKKYKNIVRPTKIKLTCKTCKCILERNLLEHNKVSGQTVKKISNAYFNNEPLNWECRKCASFAINQKVANIRKIKGDKFFNLTKEQKTLQVHNANITRAKTGNLGFQNFSKEQMKIINKKSLKTQKENSTGVYDINHQIEANKKANKSIDCPIHGHIEVSFGGKCGKCLSNESFNRENFYLSNFKLIFFKSINKTISFDIIDSLKGISGVWSIECISNKNECICLEVCESIDIGNEMKTGIRCINKGIENINKSDEQLSKIYTNKLSKYIKYKNIANYIKDNKMKIIFKLIAEKIEVKEQRFNIESQYAHDNKAKFWNKAPGQAIKLI